jgi:N-acetylglutamate synthase-like GNAT family acetyltransferase
MTADAPVMLTPADDANAAETQAKPDKDGAFLMTRTGFTFYIRPAAPGDEEALAEFFRHATPEDLRFRFLTSLREVDRDRLEMMTNVDHRRTEDFLAYEMNGGPIIATAMMAADPSMETAEVAVSVRPDYRKRGIGWTLLQRVSRFAEAKGIKTLQSIESRDNSAGIELERDMGFTARPCPGDPTLVILEAKLGGGC